MDMTQQHGWTSCSMHEARDISRSIRHQQEGRHAVSLVSMRLPH